MKFICNTTEIPAGEILRVEIPELGPLAVYNLNGEFYVTSDICTHGEASLSEGMIFDNSIECPYHGGAFDIRSGEPTATPCIVPLKTYVVRVEDEQVFIELD